jgi:hypothetical protein
MSRVLEPGTRVRLHEPERGYWYAELVEQCGLKWLLRKWLLRLSSGYEFTLYPDEFDVE